MNVVFYKVNDPTQKVDKELIQGTTIQGNLKNDCGVLNPTIVFTFSNELLTFNYAYIPQFNRYYYIGEPKYIENRYEIPFKCDVLKSHSEDIKNSVGTILRSQSGSKFLNDSRIVNTSEHSYQFKKMGTGFTKRDCYVLNVVGD